MGKKLIIKNADFSVNSIGRVITLDFTYFGSKEPTVNRKAQLSYDTGKNPVGYYILNLSSNSSAANWKVKYCNMADYVGHRVLVTKKTSGYRLAVINVIPTALNNNDPNYATFDAIGSNGQQIATSRVNAYVTVSASGVESNKTGDISVTNGDSVVRLSDTFDYGSYTGVYLFIIYVEGSEPDVEVID